MVKCCGKKIVVISLNTVVDLIEQWFSKCGTRTTSGTWDSSSGTQRNLRIKYKSGRVSTKAFFFFLLF